MTIKISAEELSNLDETSIALEDGSGFIAETAIYHELHCVVRPQIHQHPHFILAVLLLVYDHKKWQIMFVPSELTKFAETHPASSEPCLLLSQHDGRRAAQRGSTCWYVCTANDLTIYTGS